MSHEGLARASLAAAVAIGLSACAGRVPAPVQVVQPQDRFPDCIAIFSEVQANNAKVQQLASDQGLKTAQNVAAGVAGGFVVPRLWFGMDFQGTADKETAALQSRQQYLVTLAEQRAPVDGSPPGPPPRREADDQIRGRGRSMLPRRPHRAASASRHRSPEPAEPAMSEADRTMNSRNRIPPGESAIGFTTVNLAMAFEAGRLTGKDVPQGPSQPPPCRRRFRVALPASGRAVTPRATTPSSARSAGRAKATSCRCSRGRGRRGARIFSSVSVSPRKPLTCAQPVMPGSTLWRRA